jgi:predicted enzyme related to lactoylglutathione lyase
MAKKKTVRRKPVAKKTAPKKTVKTTAARTASKKAPARRPARAAAAAPAAPARPANPNGPSVVHWEVQARDLAAQQKFFADLFGWTVDSNNPMNYGMVTAYRQGIGGGIGATMDAPRAIFYVQVTDINASLAKVESLGGQSVMPRTDLGMVVMAQFRDPEGNVIGLVEGPES